MWNYVRANTETVTPNLLGEAAMIAVVGCFGVWIGAHGWERWTLCLSNIWLTIAALHWVLTLLVALVSGELRANHLARMSVIAIVVTVVGLGLLWHHKHLRKTASPALEGS